MLRSFPKPIFLRNIVQWNVPNSVILHWRINHGMGSKLKYSPYLFTNLLNKNCDVETISLKSQITWINFKNSFLKVIISTWRDQIEQSMDRFFEQNNKECMRNMMLRQDEIFKQQVHELHRLYQVQKLLMAELRPKEVKLHSLASANTPTTVKDAKSRYWSCTSSSETDHSSYISNQPFSTPLINSKYNSRHQSITLPPRKVEDFNPYHPTKEEVTPSKEVWADEESDVELTLSIGCGSGKTKSKQWVKPKPSPSDQPVRPERGEEECSERENLQRPPRLFQAMSLN